MFFVLQYFWWGIICHLYYFPLYIIYSPSPLFLSLRRGCFQNFLRNLLLGAFDLDGPMCDFISIYSVWVSVILESVSWCHLPNLRTFQLLFFQINFLPESFTFPPGNSVTCKIYWYCPKIHWELLIFKKIFFLFVL